MKKSDMLKINKTDFSFSNMGLFDSEAEWLHPTVTIDTFEIIYVLAGEIHLFEGNVEYTVKKGELLLLEPFLEHGGTLVSTGYTSFYWLHFQTNDRATFPFPKHFAPNNDLSRRLAELMHLQRSDHTIAELALARLLLELGKRTEYGNRTAHEIYEFIRINAQRPLTVQDVAKRFGYSADHLSRILKAEFGCDTKSAIVKERLEYIESLLINTDFSIKEIAEQCGFDDENKFVKFFKYHTATTPSLYRSRYFYVHMNSK